MARPTKLDLSNIQEHRRKLGMNQSEFWSRYGVTQSGGSRYESGRNMPLPTAILIYLRETGQLTDDQLAAAKKAIAKSRRTAA
jgi:transcriptional regulator with XRE-family HTH domain